MENVAEVLQLEHVVTVAITIFVLIGLWKLMQLAEVKARAIGSEAARDAVLNWVRAAEQKFTAANAKGEKFAWVMALVKEWNAHSQYKLNEADVEAAVRVISAYGEEYFNDPKPEPPV